MLSRLTVCGFPLRSLTCFVFILEFLQTNSVFKGNGISQLYDNKAVWVKDITKRQDKVTLTCPTGHVIYGPQLLLGARASQNEAGGTGSVSERDCRGLTHNAQTQINKCYWERSCLLKWRERMPIVTSSNANCVGVIPDYVIINNPICIPTDNIVTMCIGDDVISEDFGILRSHDSFPWSPKRGNQKTACRKILIPKKHHSLIVSIHDLNMSEDDSLVVKVYHWNRTGQPILRNDKNSSGDVMFSVTSGTLIVDYVIGATTSARAASGFVMKFEQKFCPDQHDEVLVGEAAARIASFGISPLEAVRGTINRCLNNDNNNNDEEDAMTLTCPQPEDVIFRPEVRHGVTGPGGRRCHGEASDCRGLTHSMLVQRNQCHWRPHCRLSWRARVPILMPERAACMAQSPDYVELGGAQCLPRDALYDICDNSYWDINTTSGYLRSHADFPWNYADTARICRKRICAHRKFGLRISSLDGLDLSLNEKGDHVKVYHVTEGNARRLVKVYRQRERIEQCFEYGCVDVEFKTYSHQNRGKGFVLHLGTLRPVLDNSTDFYRCGSLVDAVRMHRRLVAEKTLQQQTRLTMKSECLKSRWTCDGKYSFRTTPEELQKKLRVGCKKGMRLAELSLKGHNDTCQGLTPDLFVEINRCHWKQECTLKYDVSATNYMLKLYEGNASQCVTRQPDAFTFSYQCTHKKAEVLDLGADVKATAKAGIVRSHEYHPWHYKRGGDNNLTLTKPSKKLKHFVFTIRTLSLAPGDSLNVTGKSLQDSVNITADVTPSDTLTARTHVIKNIENDVSVVLNKSHYTNGGDGFVFCFRWMRWKKKYEKKGYDCCKKLILPMKCKAKRG